MSVTTDVVIVGAGPTGLLLAGDLAGAGVDCAVLERRGDESNLTRAFAVHARTLELLDARGLADELVATGVTIGAVRALGSFEVDLSQLPSRFPFVLVTPQYNTERLLQERARRLGAEIVNGAEVVGLRQDGDGVDLEVRAADGATHTRRAGYVVGADGVRSTVRHVLGQPFPGRSVVRSLMLADVRLEAAPAEVLSFNAIGDALALIAPFGDGWYRVIAWNRRHQLPDNAPVELEEIREITKRALGSDYGMHDPRWLSRFHSDERQVPHYRVGRVFLAGDAAHVHSPAGGLGMNTGLQDAANLGWKLAWALHGWAPRDLLDTYQSERHPVGRSVLRTSGTALRFALLEPAPLRAARDALGGLAARIGPVARRAAMTVSALAVEYPAPPGAHRLAGKRAADVPLAGAAAAAPGGPNRLYEALRGGRFVLLAPTGDPPDVVDGWAGRVDLATTVSPTGTLVLVRPDGYIAWACDERDPERRATALRAALTDACGAPTTTGDKASAG